MKNILFDKLIKHNQEHILKYWDELDQRSREELEKQIEKIDFDLIDSFKTLLGKKDTGHYKPGTLEPLDVIELPVDEHQKSAFQNAQIVGEKCLQENKVGVIVVAGGQGTRLGFNGPKGTFSVGPVTDRSLFQYHVEKIMALEKKFSCTIPFYIMTSETNNNETIDFFEKKNYFGKNKSDFVFFTQRMLPPLDSDGRILMADKGKISRSPDGHGGLLTAIKRGTVFQDMQKRGLEYLFYFQVDNVLVKICDPVYIGFHVLEKSDMSSKTVYKCNPHEKLGNIGRIDGECTVIEYTELSDEEKNARNNDDRLKFGQGSIAIHVFSLSFFERLFTQKIDLPYHVALKKIKCIDDNGIMVDPKTPNGYKFEQFIFDALPYAKNVMVLETDRFDDFSPIKNAKDYDSPETARQDLSNLFGRWLESCGVAVPKDDQGNVTIKIEISPLFALDKDDLIGKIDNLKVTDSILLE